MTMRSRWSHKVYVPSEAAWGNGVGGVAGCFAWNAATPSPAPPPRPSDGVISHQREYRTQVVKFDPNLQEVGVTRTNEQFRVTTPAPPTGSYRRPGTPGAHRTPQPPQNARETQRGVQVYQGQRVGQDGTVYRGQGFGQDGTVYRGQGVGQDGTVYRGQGLGQDVDVYGAVVEDGLTANQISRILQKNALNERQLMEAVRRYTSEKDIEEQSLRLGRPPRPPMAPGILAGRGPRGHSAAPNNNPRRVTLRESPRGGSRMMVTRCATPPNPRHNHRRPSAGDDVGYYYDQQGDLVIDHEPRLTGYDADKYPGAPRGRDVEVHRPTGGVNARAWRPPGGSKAAWEVIGDSPASHYGNNNNHHSNNPWQLARFKNNAKPRVDSRWARDMNVDRPQTPNKVNVQLECPDAGDMTVNMRVRTSHDSDSWPLGGRYY